jgi:hypothetical protein
MWLLFEAGLVMARILAGKPKSEGADGATT